MIEDSEIVGLEYINNAELFKGDSGFIADSHSFYHPVELGTAIRFSAPADTREYRNALKDLENAVKKGPDPGLPQYQRNVLIKRMKEMSRKALPRNADHAFEMMWYLRLMVSDYPTSGPTFQKVAKFYNMHSPEIVHNQHHPSWAPRSIEPSRSQGKVGPGSDLDTKVGVRKRLGIGTEAFVELASMRKTGAVHFSPDGGESFGTQFRARIRDKMQEGKTARGL